MENRDNRETGRLLKPSEVAAMFGVDRRTVLNWSKSGKLAQRQRTAGGHGRYDEADALSLLAELRAA